MSVLRGAFGTELPGRCCQDFWIPTELFRGIGQRYSIPAQGIRCVRSRAGSPDVPQMAFVLQQARSRDRSETRCLSVRAAPKTGRVPFFDDMTA